MASNEKFTALETAAIKRKWERFKRDAERALQPVFALHLGDTNSGSFATDIADHARGKYSDRLKDAALAELTERFEYLAELMEERP